MNRSQAKAVNAVVRWMHSPPSLVVFWFTGLILLGTLFLLLPFAQNPGAKVTVLSALFTATSAACVTGLNVLDTGLSFAFPGQFALIVLMEMGGLGVMTFACLGFRALGMRLSLLSQAAISDSLFQSDSAQEFRTAFGQIMRITMTIQAVGAIVIFISLLPKHIHDGKGVLFAAWSAIFHAVASFSNSGFSLYSDNLIGLRSNWLFMSAIISMIVIGGIGFTVLVELRNLPKLFRLRDKKPHWLSLHTKVVLIVTIILLIVGPLLIWLLGTENGGHSFSEALFQSISARTAGFCTADIAMFPLPSLFVLIILMFIGASPGSCGGGIKTTSLAIWFARIKSNLRQESDVRILGYTVDPTLVSRARLVMALSVMWNTVGVFLLTVLHEGESLQTLVFEQVSAFGTVGLSMSFTPKLEPLAQVWIILSMFIGRLGPLTLVLWVVPTRRGKISCPIGKVMIG